MSKTCDPYHCDTGQMQFHIWLQNSSSWPPYELNIRWDGLLYLGRKFDVCTYPWAYNISLPRDKTYLNTTCVTFTILHDNILPIHFIWMPFCSQVGDYMGFCEPRVKHLGPSEQHKKMEADQWPYKGCQNKHIASGDSIPLLESALPLSFLCITKALFHPDVITLLSLWKLPYQDIYQAEVITLPVNWIVIESLLTCHESFRYLNFAVLKTGEKKT